MHFTDKEKGTPVQGSQWTEEEIVTKKALIVKLREHAVPVVDCIEAAGVAKTTYYRWMHEDSEFKKKVQDGEESLKAIVDQTIATGIKAEAKMMELYSEIIQQGQGTPVPIETPKTIFFAKTRGGKSGIYSEKQHLTAEISVNSFADAMKNMRKENKEKEQNEEEEKNEKNDKKEVQNKTNE